MPTSMRLFATGWRCTTALLAGPIPTTTFRKGRHTRFARLCVYPGRSQAATCGSPVQWIAWTSNVLLSSFHQAIRLSSSSTRCKVISTEKLLPCGGAHWAILNRSCTGPARGCNTCCGRVSAIPSAITGRSWNQLWTRRPLLDRYAHNKKMNTAAAPTNLRISIFPTSPSRLVNPIS